MSYLTEDNTPAEHAQAVLDAIEAHPEAFDMRHYIGKIGFSNFAISESMHLAPDQDPSDCGTTLCVAGWIAHNAGLSLSYRGGSIGSPPKAPASIRWAAENLLGDLDGQLGVRLFFTSEERAKTILRFLAEGHSIAETIARFDM